MALRFGLFGGTFDPPHRGHIAAAVAVHRELGLDRTFLMVANEPWQKAGVRQVTPAAVRLAMVQAATKGHEGLEAGDLEIARGGVTYTADTVVEMGLLWPGAEIHVIVGADAARGFPTWERHREIARLARLVAVTRPGHRPHLGPEWLTVEVPAVDISSTDIRARVRDGIDIAGDVSDEVAAIIVEHGLYRTAKP